MQVHTQVMMRAVLIVDGTRATVDVAFLQGCSRVRSKPHGSGRVGSGRNRVTWPDP